MASLVAVAVLSGCSSSLSTRTGEVVVVSDAGVPIPGATVRADPIDPHHPLNLGDYLRADPQRLGVWTTGPGGRAAISLLADRPTELNVFAPGFFPASRVVDPGAVAEVRLELAPIEGSTVTTHP